jgi:hypothetical protein
MLRRDFLRAAAALAGYELLNGVYQPARRIFALGGVAGFNAPLLLDYRIEFTAEGFSWVYEGDSWVYDPLA